MRMVKEMEMETVRNKRTVRMSLLTRTILFHKLQEIKMNRKLMRSSKSKNLRTRSLK